MAISKEQWAKILATAKTNWFSLEFSLRGYAIQVCRKQISESRLILAVYINGVIDGRWMKDLSEINESDALDSVLTQVWFHRFKALYKKTQLQHLDKIKKSIGAKRFKELYGATPHKDGITYLTPYFSTASTLVRQFRKIEGLELVKLEGVV